MRRLIFGARNR